MSRLTRESLDSRNQILTSIDDAQLALLIGDLEPVDLAAGHVIFNAGDHIDHVYFPHDSMHSVVALTAEGQTVESGLVGFEGVCGVTLFLNEDHSFNQHIVQLPGRGHRLNGVKALEVFSTGGTFQREVLKFVRSFMAQVTQTALCNRVHTAEQRLAKWLLSCHDRAIGDQLEMTQEFLAVMLGSNRTSVNLAATELQRKGHIEYSRGKITIVDRKGLKKTSCECHEKISRQYSFPKK
jgi:CRP-like cAMP-binding protein